MPNYRDEKVTYDAELVNETEKAWLFEIDNKKHWIPKSIGEWNPSRDRVSGTVDLPNWFVEKEGIE